MQYGFEFEFFNTIGIQGGEGSTNWGTTAFSPLETASPGNSSSGFAPASFLIGDVDSGKVAQDPYQAMVMPYLAAYAQDAWKLRHDLTFTYGLRWEYTPPVVNRDNRLANFDPNLPNPGAGNILGALEYAGTGIGLCDCRQFSNAWHLGFGPRIGMAWSPKPTTVLRAGYGLMYDEADEPAVHLNQQGLFRRRRPWQALTVA